MSKILSVIAVAAGMVALMMVVVVSAAPEAPLASTISIEPIYQSGDSSVKVGDIFTQRVRFERTDSTGSLQFEIQIDKSIMFETFMRPGVSKSGSINTNKVFQTDEAFHWRGSVSGDGFIEIDVPTRVGDCGKPPEDCPNAIAVKVVNTGGETVLSDDATVSLAAGDFDRSQIMFETFWTDGSALPLVGDSGTCLNDCEPAFIAITNNNSVPARAVIRGEAPAGMKWNRSAPAIFSDMDFTDGRASDADGSIRYFDVSLKANETVTLTLNLGLIGDREDEAEFTLDLKGCTEQAGNLQCPFADGLVDLDALTFRSRRRDLGDAPDSSNHFATAMEAYTGVQANFPTTADPALAGPHGPFHARPWPLHLGRRVSFEARADVGPDQDGINNIEPGLAVPIANQDRGDDGVPLQNVTFNACETATIPVRVAILPSVVANLEGPAYLNVWLDGNRDGDWADSANCDASAFEHIVIDHEVDVAMLGAGFHTLNVTTNLIPKEIDDSTGGAWMRVMLSDEKSTKLTGEDYGDGRGKGSAYALGETEDYLYYKETSDSEGFQPNIEIMVEEVDRGDERRDNLANGGERAPDAMPKATRELIIRFRNNGFKPAKDLQIDVTLGKELDQILYDSWNGCLTCVRSAEVYQSHDTVLLGSEKANTVFPRFKTFNIGTVEPGGFGTIVLGWTGCLTCVRSVDAIASHTVLARTSENSWVAKFERRPDRLATPFIRLGYTGCLTCVRQVEDGQAITGWDEGVAAIKAKPGQTLKVLKNGVETGQSGTAGPDGFWMAELQVDPDEKAVYQAIALEGSLQSEPSNELDMSCPASGVQIFALDRFVDGRVTNFAPLKPAEAQGDIRMVYNEGVQSLMIEGGLKGENRLIYKVCRDQETDLSMNYLGTEIEFEDRFNLGDLIVKSWNGCLTCTRSVESTDVTFTVVATPTGTSSAFEYTTDFVYIQEIPSGVITNRDTGEPIADAEVIVLRRAGKGSGRSSWEDVGHCVTTLKDGSWSALVPEGEYMVVVKKDGYQTYRSRPIQVFEPNDKPLFDTISGRHELGFNIGMPPAVASTETAQVVDISNGNLGNIFVHISANTPVRFQNNGGADTSLTAQIDGRSVQATSIDSGLIASGESFMVQFDQPGTYTYQVAGDSEQEGTIVVTESSSGHTIYLPAVIR